MPSPANLPAPDDDQLEASRRLSASIADAIRAAGGWIGFDDWMARALYTPGLGYYAGGSRKFGAAGDFVTAPEISPLFGRCVAAQLGQWFEQGAPETIWEFGAGTGALAATLLEALAEAGRDRVAYRIVELSGELRERQRETLARQVPEALDRVEWLSGLPDRIEGVVLGNELLDAMPVRLFRLSGDEVLERGVALEHAAAPERRAASGRGEQAEAGAAPAGEPARFAFSDRPADAAFARAVRAALDESGWAGQGGWPDGYASELGEQAAAWVASVAVRLERGALLLIDYGFPRPEFYHPQRARGTLICHYRHRAHDDPLWLPGLQDITAHVDFSAAHAAALAAGLQPLGYASQASFLIGCGLPELAMRIRPEAAGDWARQAAALQKLVSEAEMGELFKAIAWARGLPDEAIGFARGDRRAALLAPGGSDLGGQGLD
ncbi:SAM-dependent methyltransferase [Burkholderiaceae bacterium FT117]|uniref:class I SAM-dependent methyltransferase n=1 Tax=Zeimonas sediminis TaxID=2944268 RepID=UPI0023430F1C|nr:SAM-dependent methyltransferase [Zeimonas sediminis]MCM5571638.1 SAM-dependent methyltransferase [Zeimonas sediminis]